MLDSVVRALVLKQRRLENLERHYTSQMRQVVSLVHSRSKELNRRLERLTYYEEFIEDQLNQLSQMRQMNDEMIQRAVQLLEQGKLRLAREKEALAAGQRSLATLQQRIEGGDGMKPGTEAAMKPDRVLQYSPVEQVTTRHLNVTLPEETNSDDTPEIVKEETDTVVEEAPPECPTCLDETVRVSSYLFDNEGGSFVRMDTPVPQTILKYPIEDSVSTAETGVKFEEMEPVSVWQFEVKEGETAEDWLAKDWETLQEAGANQITDENSDSIDANVSGEPGLVDNDEALSQVTLEVREVAVGEGEGEFCSNAVPLEPVSEPAAAPEIMEVQENLMAQENPETFADNIGTGTSPPSNPVAQQCWPLEQTNS